MGSAGRTPQPVPPRLPPLRCAALGDVRTLTWHGSVGACTGAAVDEDREDRWIEVQQRVVHQMALAAAGRSDELHVALCPYNLAKIARGHGGAISGQGQRHKFVQATPVEFIETLTICGGQRAGRSTERFPSWRDLFVTA